MYLENKQLNQRKIQRISLKQGQNGRKSKWRRKKNSEQMIREMGKSEGEESLKTRPKKLKNSGKPKGHAINPIDQHAATTHLIQNETPRVMDSSANPFIFYGCHDTSWQPQMLGGN